MADTNDTLSQINKRFDALEQGIEGTIQTLKQGQARTNNDLQGVKQSLAQTNTALAQNTTMVESVLAGQEELQKATAREASVQDLKAILTKKVNDHEERITELEKEAGIPHPHKH